MQSNDADFLYESALIPGTDNGVTIVIATQTATIPIRARFMDRISRHAHRPLRLRCHLSSPVVYTWCVIVLQPLSSALPITQSI